MNTIMAPVLSSSVRRAALVLGAAALALGALAPAAQAAPTAGAQAVPAAVVAAKKKAKKAPPRVGTPKLVTNGSRNHNVRISWPWIEGVKHYEVQAGLTKKFAKAGRVKATRRNTARRPSGGRLEMTVEGLQNATVYYVRVRAVAKNGTKGAWSKPRKVKTKVHIPERITSFTATPGPKPGQVTFSWKHKPTYTTHLELHLATTVFHPDGTSGMPKEGNDYLKVKVPVGSKSSGSFTLSKARATKAGSPLGSGNHLYYRVYAVNKGSAGTKKRILPNLRAVKPAGPAVAAGKARSTILVGTFNLASNLKDPQGRGFADRVERVADAIVAKSPGIVGIQELSPGWETLRSGQIRTTELLVRRLAAMKTRYTMVQTSPYVRGGSNSEGLKIGSQGARILYDAARLELLSDCPNYTGNYEYSTACSVEMNPAPGEDIGRMAALAKFRDRTTQQEFWFVSLHLTPDPAKKNYDPLRVKQVTTVLTALKKRNPENLPVIVTGDLNSWQTRATGNPAQATFLGAGFVDTFATATTTVNPQFATLNDWQTSPREYPQGFGVRLDYILTKGALGASRWENVMKAKDSARPSDHNLVLATVHLP